MFEVFLVNERWSTLLRLVTGRLGLSPMEYAVLSMLARVQLRPSDLATTLSVPKSTVTGLVATLEHKGWLERRPSVDGRAVTLTITEDGRAQHRLTRDTISRSWDAAVAEGRPEARACLVEIRQALDAAIVELSSTGSPAVGVPDRR